MSTKPTTSPEPVALTIVKAEPRIDSRLLALQLGNQHKNVRELLEEHKVDFMELGVLRFETAKPTSDQGGRPEKFAILNEDQCYLLLTYSRNTARTRQLKVKLVKAFGEARRAAGLRQAEYLPTYHALHDEIHALAAGSEHERHVHMNVNQLINKTVGLEAGQRGAASMPVQSLLAVAQAVAVKAARGAADHRDGYQRIKSAMGALSAATLGLEACS
jgi:phage regulator Rha-like protein